MSASEELRAAMRVVGTPHDGPIADNGNPQNRGITTATEVAAHPYNRNPLVIAECSTAVRDAEERLADLCCVWPSLSIHVRAVALKFAVMDMVVVYVSEPVRGEIWFGRMAKMMDVPKSQLRKLIMRRADIIINIKALWRRRRAETEGEVVSWML